MTPTPCLRAGEKLRFWAKAKAACMPRLVWAFPYSCRLRVSQIRNAPAVLCEAALVHAAAGPLKHAKAGQPVGVPRPRVESAILPRVEAHPLWAYRGSHNMCPAPPERPRLGHNAVGMSLLQPLAESRLPQVIGPLPFVRLAGCSPGEAPQAVTLTAVELALVAVASVVDMSAPPLSAARTPAHDARGWAVHPPQHRVRPLRDAHPVKGPGHHRRVCQQARRHGGDQHLRRLGSQASRKGVAARVGRAAPWVGPACSAPGLRG